MSASPVLLHVVTDDATLARPDLLTRVGEILESGGERVALHLRGPRTSGVALHALAVTLGPIARTHGACLVVNDRVDVALAAGVRVVHLGRRSLPVDAVRRIVPGVRIGVSCHDATEVREAVRSGADYLVCGHVFETQSHPGQAPLGIDGLERLVTSAGKLPVVAIGGVSLSSVASLRSAGASSVAVLSGVWGHRSPGGAVSEYISSLDTE